MAMSRLKRYVRDLEKISPLEKLPETYRSYDAFDAWITEGNEESSVARQDSVTEVGGYCEAHRTTSLFSGCPLGTELTSSPCEAFVASTEEQQPQVGFPSHDFDYPGRNSSDVEENDYAQAMTDDENDDSPSERVPLCIGDVPSLLNSVYIVGSGKTIQNLLDEAVGHAQGIARPPTQTQGSSSGEETQLTFYEQALARVAAEVRNKETNPVSLTRPQGGQDKNITLLLHESRSEICGLLGSLK